MTQLLNWENQANSNRTPLTPYKRTFPDIKKAGNKYWDVLKINKDFKELFTEPLIIPFRQNRNLHDILANSNESEQQKKCIKEKAMIIQILAIPNEIIYIVHSYNQTRPLKVQWPANSQYIQQT